jgi:hypothetical protein
MRLLDNIIFPNSIRRIRWAGHAARIGEMRNVYGILVGKPEGTRPQRRPRRRWVVNIEIDLEI